MLTQCLSGFFSIRAIPNSLALVIGRYILVMSDYPKLGSAVYS